MGKRDGDFSPKTRRSLADSVSWMCSICQSQTLAAATDRRSMLRVGQACHIRAASRGGPRFDEKMSWMECRDATNGIWLCNICAKIIDLDLDNYTVERLHRLKIDAETRSVENLGKRLLTEREATLGSYTFHRELVGEKTFNPQHAINTLVEGHSLFLEEKDPRFSVKLAMESNKILTTIRRKPGEDINLIMHPMAASNGDTLRKISDLMENGTQATFSNQEVDIEGSPLLKYALGESKGVTIGLKELPANFSLRVIDKKGKSYLLGSSQGTCSWGHTKSTLTGKVRSIITVTLIQRITKPYTYTLNIEVDLTDWSRRPINEIEYLEWLCKCFEVVVNAGKFQFSIEEDANYFESLITMEPPTNMTSRLSMAVVCARLLLRVAKAFSIKVYFLEANTEQHAFRQLDFLTQLKESGVIFQRFEGRTTKVSLENNTPTCKTLKRALSIGVKLFSFGCTSGEQHCEFDKNYIKATGIKCKYTRMNIEILSQNQVFTEFKLTGSKNSEIEYEAGDFFTGGEARPELESPIFPKIILD